MAAKFVIRVNADVLEETWEGREHMCKPAVNGLSLTHA